MENSGPHTTYIHQSTCTHKIANPEQCSTPSAQFQYDNCNFVAAVRCSTQIKCRSVCAQNLLQYQIYTAFTCPLPTHCHKQIATRKLASSIDPITRFTSLRSRTLQSVGCSTPLLSSILDILNDGSGIRLHCRREYTKYTACTKTESGNVRVYHGK